MPIITRNELTELCHDIRTNIDVWIRRGKIITVEGNKKLIDTENPVNALFIQQRQDVHEQKKLLGEGVSVKINNKTPKDIGLKIETKLPKKVKSSDKPPKKIIANPEKVVVVPKLTPGQRREEVRRMNDQNLRAQIKVDQEAKLRQQVIDLKELQIQSEKIRLDKTAGNLLPIDLGLGVIERHANSVLKTFEKGFERIADIYANIAGMDPTTRTDFIKECRVELSHCVETAGKSAEAEIDILVDNYAETLMVGQKKA
jgi:hypothetical protein